MHKPPSHLLDLIGVILAMLIVVIYYRDTIFNLFQDKSTLLFTSILFIVMVVLGIMLFKSLGF